MYGRGQAQPLSDCFLICWALVGLSCTAGHSAKELKRQRWNVEHHIISGYLSIHIMERSQCFSADDTVVGVQVLCCQEQEDAIPQSWAGSDPLSWQGFEMLQDFSSQ